MAIKQSVLRNKSMKTEAYSTIAANDRWVANKAASAVKTAFLCHSHKDRNLVEGFIELLSENGVQIYVDWKDLSMPEKPNAETARKIKNKINEHDLFLFLATHNSKASRWCPWEIGYADNSIKPIYIIPTEDDSGHTYGNEYLDLYPKIDTGYSEGHSGYAVYKPGMARGEWVTKSALVGY